MDRTKERLALDFALGRISIDDFVQKFGADPRDPNVVHKELEEALAERSPEGVGCAIILAARFGLSREWAGLFCALLDADWHYNHEDIAHLLQGMRVPSTVECLCRAALKKHAYLDYNNSSALARKCIWALHDIGTKEAFEKLAILATSDDDLIRECAEKRLKDADKRTEFPTPPFRE
jgi:hypothetical protein